MRIRIWNKKRKTLKILKIDFILRPTYSISKLIVWNMLILFYISIPCNLIPSVIFCFVCRKNFKRLICNSCIILHFYISKNSKLQYSWLWKVIYLHPFYTVICCVKRIFVLKRLSNYLFFISTMSIMNLIYVSQFQNIRDLKSETKCDFVP